MTPDWREIQCGQLAHLTLHQRRRTRPMADRNLGLVIQSVQNEFQARATVLCASSGKNGSTYAHRWSEKVTFSIWLSGLKIPKQKRIMRTTYKH